MHHSKQSSMKHFLLSALFFLFALSGLKSQIFQGEIVNNKNEAVPNSSIYIRELSKGIVADDNGRFQTEIAAGRYTCEFRSMGYKSQSQTVDIPVSGRMIQVKLEEKIYGLREVIIYAKDEDPAYRIMRRAIAYAPFYRNQVESYQSNTYVKGSFRIDKIPRIFKAISRVNDQDVDVKDLIGSLFVMESDNEIRFTAPNNYHQRVKAAKSSIPPKFDMGKEALGVVTENIYTMNFLLPGAFRYYKFKLEDVEYNNSRIVNKIKVIPRRKNGNLYSGYLYILEDRWNVYAADLLSTEMGSTLRYRITFHEVKPSVYLPTTYDMSLDINSMGVKGEGRYYVSVTYQSVRVKVDKIPTVISTTMLPKTIDTLSSSKTKTVLLQKEKTLKRIAKLSGKENLSTKEAYRLSKLMQSVLESEEERKNQKSLEIKKFEKVNIDIDSLAFCADSAYWARVRVLPLQIEEQKSYTIADSINPPDSMYTLKKGSRTITVGGELGPKSVFGKILLGGGFRVNKNASLRFSGLTDVLNGYSFVDGFPLGQIFTYHQKLDSNRYITIKPSVHYVTARKTVRWQTETTWYYHPMRQGYVHLSFGHTAADLNSSFGMSKLLDAYTSLIYGKNFIRYYDKKFVHVSHQIDIANGLNWAISMNYENRSSLKNYTSFNVFNRTPRRNMPETWYLDFSNHKAAVFGVELSYTPRYRYKIESGQKSYVLSAYPTFTMQYKKGTDVSSKQQWSLFDVASLTISQKVSTSLFSKFNYAVSAGTFFNRKSLHLPDYKYFIESPMAVTEKTFDDSFNLLPEYIYSKRYWAEAHLNYTSDYLLLKNLSFLQSMLFDEGIHLHFLHADNQFTHYEGGYSVGLTEFSRIGVFMSFDGKKINGTTVRVSLPLLSIF